jgi:hypothetical protein
MWQPSLKVRYEETANLIWEVLRQPAMEDLSSGMSNGVVFCVKFL